jgi:hypothetical protein
MPGVRSRLVSQLPVLRPNLTRYMTKQSSLLFALHQTVKAGNRRDLGFALQCARSARIVEDNL